MCLGVVRGELRVSQSNAGTTPALRYTTPRRWRPARLHNDLYSGKFLIFGRRHEHVRQSGFVVTDLSPAFFCKYRLNQVVDIIREIVIIQEYIGILKFREEVSGFGFGDVHMCCHKKCGKQRNNN